MAKSKIEWTEKVWNPLTGCNKVGLGCKNCYAEIMSKRLKAMGRPEYQNAVDDGGHWTGQITLLEDRLADPLKWKKSARIFVNSMSDLFHEDVPSAFIQRVVGVMCFANQHTYQILTKRYARPATELNQQDASDHILIGFSVCNQDDANKALASVRAVHQLGWRTWVSYEPALEIVNWSGWEFLDWMVCGGESGSKARPMHPLWARSAREFCQGSHIPFLFKQWGEWGPQAQMSLPEKWTYKTKPIRAGDDILVKAGRALTGRLLDGVEWNEYPKVGV